MEEDSFVGKFKLNSSIELVCDESEEFDVLDNEELQVDFTPLFEALHIHDALGQSERFRAEYSMTRRQQKDLLIPTSVELLSEDESSLSSLLEGIAGFAIIEKATTRRAPQLRPAADVSPRPELRPTRKHLMNTGRGTLGVHVYCCHQSNHESLE